MPACVSLKVSLPTRILGSIVVRALVALCVAVLTPASPAAWGALIAVPGDHPTIQDAVDAAGAGDTIRVASGDYSEAVLVSGPKDGLTIEAADAANPPIVRGTPNASNDGIRVDGLTGVTIRNMQIIGAYNGIRLNGVTGALLTGLYVEDNALGIRVYLGRDNRVAQCTIVTTRVEQGIFIDSSAGIVLAQNSITDAAHGGIRVLNSPCAILDTNQVSGNRGSDGISIDHSDGASVRDCTAHDNYRHGIMIANSHGLTLAGNTANDNGNLGLRIDKCAPFESVADVVSSGNGGSGNSLGEIDVAQPAPGSSSSVQCAPVATPTPGAAATTTAGVTPGPTPSDATVTVSQTPSDATATATVSQTPSDATATATVSQTPSVTATATTGSTSTSTTTPLPSPVATITVPVPTPSSTPAPADPARCLGAITRASGAFAKAKVSALKRCEERLLEGKLGPDPGPGARLGYCLADPKSAAKIARAKARFEATIDRDCGGPNGSCGDADDNLDMQIDLGLPSACPDLGSAGCTNALTDCRAVSACLACVRDAAIERTMTVLYEDLVDAQTDTSNRPLAKCQQAIGKETLKYLLAREKALGKCWHDRLKGRHTETCPTVGTRDSIRRSDARRVAKICRACGGTDRECDQPVATVDSSTPTLGGSGGDDDLTPTSIGFGTTCPDVTVPANTSHADVECGGPVVTLADLAFCVGCVTDFAVDCGGRSGVQSLVPYPIVCNPTAPTP